MIVRLRPCNGRRRYALHEPRLLTLLQSLQRTPAKAAFLDLVLGKIGSEFPLFHTTAPPLKVRARPLHLAEAWRRGHLLPQPSCNVPRPPASHHREDGEL